MKTIKRLLIALLLTVSGVLTGMGQLAVKTNLLYDATTTPNIGAELGIGKKSTVNLVYGLNPWTFHSDSKGDRKAKHWLLMPEYRYWLCQKFGGHFFGVHLMGGQYNAGRVDLPLPGGFVSGENIRTGARNHRYEGGFLGGGLTYGYQWILSRRVNIEAEVGVGYNRVWYDKYACGDCGAKIGDGATNYLGLTKVGLSILYLF